MNATVTPDAESAITDIAQRHGLSRDAVLAMLLAVNNGGGTMAQFSIPELGGSGQWMRGGMTMVGNMFDNALKARVDALCGELSNLLATTTVFPPAPTGSSGGFTSNNWWPGDLGVPSSSGGQNDTRYAVFPGTRRLAIQVNGVTRVFDTGEHNIGGVQQQQGGAAGTVTFTSQFGTFDVSTLSELGARQVAETPVAAPAPQEIHHQAPASAPDAPVSSSPGTPAPSDDAASIVAAIESLAGLHQRGILSDDEFASKKAELLGRL
ncbi:SHOCT domain-containing protein [Gordonia sp. ABSL11-1]|uniref:SHOCT domain-containing protein n=1 Tax=Gordonia sp. ABSL11-1 TaxID=3053924 RepID=UPI002572ACA1|nr:SHOCT domain-containing protein [Gordonia sp. ABSL11-1]MDL9948360.1 SHOCT domain-containing protein [Gordonia sp. ABSL11-1]